MLHMAHKRLTARIFAICSDSCVHLVVETSWGQRDPERKVCSSVDVQYAEEKTELQTQGQSGNHISLEKLEGLQTTDSFGGCTWKSHCVYTIVKPTISDKIHDPYTTKSKISSKWWLQIKTHKTKQRFVGRNKPKNNRSKPKASDRHRHSIIIYNLYRYTDIHHVLYRCISHFNIFFSAIARKEPNSPFCCS